MDLAGATPIGGGGDDVLRGGLLQVFARVWTRADGTRRFGVQLRLTFRDDVVRLEGPRRESHPFVCVRL